LKVKLKTKIKNRIKYLTEIRSKVDGKKKPAEMMCLNIAILELEQLIKKEKK